MPEQADPTLAERLQALAQSVEDDLAITTPPDVTEAAVKMVFDLREASRRLLDLGPRFTHDCDRCTFIGRVGDRDIYTCDQGGAVNTVVARWGDEGQEYESGAVVLAGDLRIIHERRLLGAQI